MVWTCSKNGRGEIAKTSYEMASIRKEKKNKVYLNLSGQKRSED
jgi:hypothetical protein